MAKSDDKMSATEFEKLSAAVIQRLGTSHPKTHCDVVQRITEAWMEHVKTEEAGNPAFMLIFPLLELYGHIAMHQAFEYGIQYERDGNLPADFSDLTVEDLTDGE